MTDDEMVAACEVMQRLIVHVSPSDNVRLSVELLLLTGVRILRAEGMTRRDAYDALFGMLDSLIERGDPGDSA